MLLKKSVTTINVLYILPLRISGENDGSKLASFVRDPRVSPFLENDTVLQDLLTRGVKFHFALAELDSFVDDGIAYHDRLQTLASTSEATKDLVSMRISKGCTHAWAQVLSPSANPMKLGPFKQ